MRKERLFGAIGLGLFFLFPLVSLLQLRDTDDAWRTVANRARASVVVVQSEDENAPAGCAVVLQASPPRAVIAGRPQSSRLHSATPSGTVYWRVRWVDPSGEFTLLEAGSEDGADASLSASFPASTSTNLSGLVALAPSALHDIASAEESTGPVPAVLVAPDHLVTQPIWIAELSVDQLSDGRAVYHGARLRPLRDATSVASVEAEPLPPVIDPVLSGAPFVTRDGLVLALYSGERDGRPSAVPMALVRQAMVRFERTIGR